MRASLARICLSLGIEPDSAKAQEAAFTAKCSESLAWFDPASCSWKTSQQSLAGGWEPFSETWPRAGTIVAGHAYQHQQPVPRTFAIGGGVSPKMWLTPRASDTGKGEKSETFLSRMGDRTDACAQSLAAQVNNPKTWPTPTVSMADGASPGAMTRTNGKSRKGDRLDYAVAERAVDEAARLLNPPFVEWLMNWPLNWTKRLAGGKLSPKSAECAEKYPTDLHDSKP